ncbi:MAG: potassium transporter TrkG [Pseudomonadota bacterium]
MSVSVFSAGGVSAGAPRVLGAALMALGAALAAPCAIAFAAGEDSAQAFLFSMAVSGFCGAALFALDVGRPASASFSSVMVALVAWWFVTPLFAALPFWAETGGTLIDAYFEAASALTTTGGWLSPDAAAASLAGHIWRAELQWIGGLASLCVAAALFVRPEFVGIDTLLPPFSWGDQENSYQALLSALRTFTGAYTFLTGIGFLALYGAGFSPPDALTAALSLAASGGFVPGGVDALSPVQLGALTPFVLLGGANFILVARYFRSSARRTRDAETGWYVAAVATVGLGYWATAGAAGASAIPAQIFNAASLFSTNGMIVGEGPTLPIALVTIVIGGCAISTAGGFKFLRWLVIFRRAREEIRRLVIPNAVFQRSSVANEFAVWIHFLVFTLTLGVVTLVVTLDGFPFELAITAAASAIANAGPALALAEGGGEGWSVFTEPVRLLLALAMILGRLEAVVALVLLNVTIWRD